jgi:hypothetical protein
MEKYGEGVKGACVKGKTIYPETTNAQPMAAIGVSCSKADLIC